MIIVIRISGQVEMHTYSKETLFRMHLRKKYSAVLLKEIKENQPILQAVRNFVAYGKIDSKVLEELISKRAKPKDSKSIGRIDAKRVAEIIEKDGIENAGIKPF